MTFSCALGWVLSSQSRLNAWKTSITPRNLDPALPAHQTLVQWFQRIKGMKKVPRVTVSARFETPTTTAVPPLRIEL